jgi:peptidyl-dipeptidase Dcp
MSSVVSAAQSPASARNAAQTNPLLVPSPLPFEAPPFDKIKDADFRPALEEGMRQQLAEVDAIAENPAAPTFDNTLVALEKSGLTLTRVEQAFNALSSANTNDLLQKLQEEIAPKLSAHHDAILLNSKLFRRIDSLYERRAQLKLDAESARLLDYIHQQFTMAGANLSDSDIE